MVKLQLAIIQDISVSLSADGSIVAIGAYGNDANGNSSGHVRVYQRDTSVALGWTKVGQDIDCEAANDYSGHSVSLSADGSPVAIGAYYNVGNGNGTSSGHVRVYQRDTSVALGWTKVG